MYGVELYARVGRACRVEGMSVREASRVFNLDRRTLAKMLTYSLPPGYRRSKPVIRPKLDPFTGIIDRILEEDRERPAKQQHTAKRIFDRLRDEHGFSGGETIVKDYVRERRRRQREMFVPLSHPPGHAQVDFGEAVAVIGEVEGTLPASAYDCPYQKFGPPPKTPDFPGPQLVSGSVRVRLPVAGCELKSKRIELLGGTRVMWAKGEHFPAFRVCS